MIIILKLCSDLDFVTLIRRVDQLNPDKNAIMEASGILRSGGTVVFPTETVYGLGADATSDSACRSIYRIKGRPADNPLIVHFADVMMMEQYVIVPDQIRQISELIWPGPVTFILKPKKGISAVPRANLPTVAVRIPANPLALSLIADAGIPIAAPSANLSTRPSIVQSRDAITDLSGKVDFIFDSGPTFFGMESTVLLPSNGSYKVLRPGAIGIDQLEKILGPITMPDGSEDSTRPQTPGMKYRHYSPEKKLYLVEDRAKYTERIKRTGESCIPICSDQVGKRLHREYISLGDDENLYEIAKRLFPALRSLDDGDYDSGIIHGFPETGIGLAIMNRIRKASIGI